MLNEPLWLFVNPSAGLTIVVGSVAGGVLAAPLLAVALFVTLPGAFCETLTVSGSGFVWAPAGIGAG